VGLENIQLNEKQPTEPVSIHMGEQRGWVHSKPMGQAVHRRPCAEARDQEAPALEADGYMSGLQCLADIEKVVVVRKTTAAARVSVSSDQTQDSPRASPRCRISQRKTFVVVDAVSLLRREGRMESSSERLELALVRGDGRCHDELT